ncbi:Formyltransferase [Pisolithus thermaeus]|nr:Formyltransferase [Pisolithus thermaeus]
MVLCRITNHPPRSARALTSNVSCVSAISALTATRFPGANTQTRSLRATHSRRQTSADPSKRDGGTTNGLVSQEPFTILFFGRDAFSCKVFKSVYEARDIWHSLHIATNPDVKTGRRGSRLDISPLKTLGETLGVPVHTIPRERTAFRCWLPPPPFIPLSLEETAGAFELSQSHVLVTASFGRILPSSILGLFPETQRLNVHPSLLPAYRGPAPIQRALMAGERETGVCVIQMGEVSRREGKVVDQGGIWAVEKMVMPDDATFTDMQDLLAEKGGECLVQVLRNMLKGKAQCIPQAPLGAETPHAPPITAADSTVNFAAQTADVIVRLERAIGHQRALSIPHVLPGGRSVSIFGLRTIPAGSLLVSEVDSMCPGGARYSSTAKKLIVSCAGGSLLGVDKLQTQDRAILTAREWWNGLKGMELVKDGTFTFGHTAEDSMSGISQISV